MKYSLIWKKPEDKEVPEIYKQLIIIPDSLSTPQMNAPINFYGLYNNEKDDCQINIDINGGTSNISVLSVSDGEKFTVPVTPTSSNCQVKFIPSINDINTSEYNFIIEDENIISDNRLKYEPNDFTNLSSLSINCTRVPQTGLEIFEFGINWRYWINDKSFFNELQKSGQRWLCYISFKGEGINYSSKGERWTPGTMNANESIGFVISTKQDANILVEITFENEQLNKKVLQSQIEIKTTKSEYNITTLYDNSTEWINEHNKLI